MNEATYQTWWQLHLRVAKGEELSGQEREHYLATLKHLEQEEVLQEDTAQIERLQSQLAQAKAEGEHLRTYRLQLEAKLAELERSSQSRKAVAVA